MGQNVAESKFRSEEFRRFQQSLKDETALLLEWIADRQLSDKDYMVGMELELCLVDQQGSPAPLNEALLKALNKPTIVPELSQFNIELNLEPSSARGDGIRTLASRMSETWEHCTRVAQSMELSVLSIGILPTLAADHLVLGNMSQLHRFHALNEQILRLRRGRPVPLSIDGIESLASETHGRNA